MSNRAGTQADYISADGLTLASRNQAAPGGKPRTWGMQFTVTNDPTPANNTTWVLKYNNTSTNKYDNGNWVTLADYAGGGGGSGGNWKGAAAPYNTSGAYPPATAAWQTWEFQSMLTMPDGIDYPAGSIATYLPSGTWRII